MATNVISRPVHILKINDEVAGLNKGKYRPYGSRLAGVGNAIDHWSGRLEMNTLISVTYDVSRGAFETPLGEALTPATTELAQVSATTREYSYTRTPIHVEVKLSNMQGVPSANIKAGIIRELDQHWDRLLFQGGYGNSPLWDLPQALTNSDVVQFSTYEEIAEVVGDLFNKAATIHGTEPQSDLVTLSFSHNVMRVLRKPVPQLKITGVQVLQEAYKGVEIETVPIGVGLPDHVSLSFRPFIKVHHGLLPEVYSEVEGTHGITTSILFVFETPAIELEDDGAYIYQRVSTKK